MGSEGGELFTEMHSLQELCDVCCNSNKLQCGNILNVDAPSKDGIWQIQRYFGRSLPNKFPTQILSASKKLISNLFFYLSTDFRRFSFFLALLVYSFLGY